MAVEESSHAEHPQGTWRARVLNEAQRLEGDLRALPPDASVDAEAIQHNIDRARAATAPAGILKRLRDWLSGAAFETAWSSLHGADEQLTMGRRPEDLRATTTDLVAALDTCLKPDDRRLVKYRKALESIGQPAEPESRELTEDQRAEIRAALRAANTAAYVAQGVVRRWRNLLLIVGVALFVVVVALALVDATASDFLPLEGEGGEADSVDAWKVELMGAFGGAIAAVLAINRFAGYTDPHGLPLYQALLRIPMAAATSLLGIVLLQSGVLDALEPQPSGAVLAYAVLFGYAQEPLLRLIDRRAGEVLGPARGKDDPAAHPAQAPESTPGETREETPSPTPPSPTPPSRAAP